MNIGLTMWSQFDRVMKDPKGTASALASATVTNFEDLIAALQTWGQAEHNVDGTHAAVTATSVTVSGVSDLMQKVRLGGIVRYIAPGIIPTGRMDNVYTPGLETASVLKIRNTAAGISLTGIDATGRRQGDILLLINDDEVIATPRDFTIAAFDANSLTANQFIGSAASTAPWTLQGSQGVLLMYDTYTRTGVSEFSGWRVISGVA